MHTTHKMLVPGGPGEPPDRSYAPCSPCSCCFRSVTLCGEEDRAFPAGWKSLIWYSWDAPGKEDVTDKSQSWLMGPRVVEKEEKVEKEKVERVEKEKVKIVKEKVNEKVTEKVKKEEVEKVEKEKVENKVEKVRVLPGRGRNDQKSLPASENLSPASKSPSTLPSAFKPLSHISQPSPPISKSPSIPATPMLPPSPPPPYLSWRSWAAAKRWGCLQPPGGTLKGGAPDPTGPTFTCRHGCGRVLPTSQKKKMKSHERSCPGPTEASPDLPHPTLQVPDTDQVHAYAVVHCATQTQ